MNCVGGEGWYYVCFCLSFLLQFITGPHGTYAQMQYANPQPMMPTAAPFPGEVTNNNNYYTVNY